MHACPAKPLSAFSAQVIAHEFDYRRKKQLIYNRNGAQTHRHAVLQMHADNTCLPYTQL